MHKSQKGEYIIQTLPNKYKLQECMPNMYARRPRACSAYARHLRASADISGNARFAVL